MRRFSRAVQAVFLISVPAVLVICAIFKIKETLLLSTLVTIAALAVFFIQFERRRIQARDVMPVVVLSAVACAGRILLNPLPNIQPVSAIIIVGAICFGSQSGFLTGALSALISNMFLGQGAWTPWQMYLWGMMGYTAGMLANTGIFRYKTAVYVYGFISSFLMGALMDMWFVIGFVRPITLGAMIMAAGTGLVFNIMHALSTLGFLLLVLNPWIVKLSRIKQKFGLHGPNEKKGLEFQLSEIEVKKR
jgi:energy-coupling factor transport system substrate-specific component